jgi:peptide/nickel transport system substrate-binding protein
MDMKRVFALVLFFFLLMGCAPRPTEVVRVGWLGYPDSLNPGVAELSESYTIFELVYDSLFEYNPDGSFTPDLVERYTVSSDGKQWVFTLKDNVRWHDGQSLTAEDVVFSFNLYQTQEGFPYMPTYTTYFESVQARDRRTVVLNLTEAIPNMESQLFFLYILPKHIWSAYEADATQFDNIPMIGSGPFRYKLHRPGVYVELEANFQHHSTPPNVGGVIFRQFASEEEMVEALITGSVDMLPSVPARLFARISQATNVSIVSGPPLSPRVSTILINQIERANCPPGGLCSGHPALRDRVVRQALAHATDKQTIINEILFGLGRPGRTLIAESLREWYNIELEDYAYDPNISNRILQDAGYIDTDGDGVREMPITGRPLRFRMYYPRDLVGAADQARLIAEMWRPIGVDVTVVGYNPAELGNVCCPSFNYDLILWEWSSDPDPGFLLSVMTTDQIPTGLSETGYSNPQYDELYMLQATETNLTTRREIIWQMQRIAFRDLVYIIPYYQISVQAYRSDKFIGWLELEDSIALQHVTSLVKVQPVR